MQFITNNRHQINHFASAHGLHHVGHQPLEQMASATSHVHPQYSFSPPKNKPLGLSILIKDENNKYVVQNFNTHSENPHAFYDRNQNGQNKPPHHYYGGQKWPFYHYKPSEFGSKPNYNHQGNYNVYQTPSSGQIYVAESGFGGSKPRPGHEHHAASTIQPEIILHPQPTTENNGNYYGDEEQTMQYGFSHGFRGKINRTMVTKCTKHKAQSLFETHSLKEAQGGTWHVLCWWSRFGKNLRHVEFVLNITLPLFIVDCVIEV